MSTLITALALGANFSDAYILVYVVLLFTVNIIRQNCANKFAKWSSGMIPIHIM
jgi:hypothetical protein